MTIILYAIPAFFALIFIELAVDRARNTGYYQFSDAVSSLTIGMLSRVATVIKTLIPLSIYALIVDHIAITSWPSDALAWCVAFVFYDFLYYWNHRLGHEMSLFWAAHVVHHSSEEYNLTTALRQTSGSLVNVIFFIPMALLGIPFDMMLSIAALNLVYQFWVHTRHVGKMGVLDEIIVTPSNHRVHHAQNQIYIDRNYGGVFILWDRLFGTFQPELDEQQPIYGIRSALRSYNPLWSNFQVYQQLCHDSFTTKRWRDKLRVWFGRTGWRPADVLASLPAKAPFDPAQFTKYQVAISVRRTGYAFIQLLLALAMTLAILLSLSDYTVMQAVAWSGVLLLLLVAQGLVLERSRWTTSIELIKWSGVMLGIWLLPSPQWLMPLTVAVLIASGVWLAWKKDDPLQHNSRISL